ncbi:MAG TPA: helix-turn-helix domain-containing protein [Candidatus Cybelea sp.]|nr:helix-turn-helix domain-containing protein [Candidatus Cybelea sp.]
MRPEEIVAFGEALSRIAATGGGPKALAAHLASAVDGRVLLEDAQWHALATAGTGEIPASGREVVESGAPGRAARITAGETSLGWLSLFGGGADGDLFLRLTAAAIGTELSRNGSIAHERKSGFWESLLAGSVHDAGAIRDDAAVRGIALAAQYLAIALECDDAGALRALAAQTLRPAGGDLGFVERGALLFVLVPAGRALDVSNAKTAATLLPKSAARRAPNLRISGGVGTVEPPLRLRASAESAEAALSIGRRIYGSGRVAIYEDLGAYRLLYEGANAEQLRVFAAETLAPLRAYDETHQTELERTLKIYFLRGQNVKTAAAELNVHRHTVFYRLRQIGEISERSLDSPHDQLTLRLAVAIDELYNAN